jgi:phosphotransferase system HPr-like phosphotransfer protein
MANVLVNGEVTPLTYPANTWGELLDVLDQQCGANGDVVTAVRLNGVDVPSFREAETLSEPLGANADVFIETARPADLIHQALDEAEAAVPSIADAAMALAPSYRAADLSAANARLAEFAESLSTLIVITSTVAQGAGVDLSLCGDEEASAMQMITSLIANTDALLAAQRAGEWTNAAEVIEGEIAGTVRRWPVVLQALRHAAPALTDVA